MKTLVLYDSKYGNTEKIARAMVAATEATVQHAAEADPSTLNTYDLIVIGSPTHGGRPTEPVQGLLKQAELHGVKVATFDTRMESRFARIFGYAANRLANNLKQKGATVLASEGFYVVASEGPLKPGETERAAEWARGLAQSGAS